MKIFLNVALSHLSPFCHIEWTQQQQRQHHKWNKTQSTFSTSNFSAARKTQRSHNKLLCTDFSEWRQNTFAHLLAPFHQHESIWWWWRRRRLRPPRPNCRILFPYTCRSLVYCLCAPIAVEVHIFRQHFSLSKTWRERERESESLFNYFTYNLELCVRMRLIANPFQNVRFLCSKTQQKRKKWAYTQWN